MSLSNLGRSLAQSAPAVRPRRLRISNSVSRSVMTWDRIRLLVREGFGHGRGEAYIPWIRVTRGLSSPVSHPTVAHTPIHVRGVHLLSGLEDSAARVAAWLGAREIREQFPLFPWAGLHPMHGLDPDRDRVLEPAPAMSDIVREAGVKLRRYIGSPVPYVATTDLVLRLGDYPNDRLVFWSCKPQKAIDCARDGDRVEEVLDLEHRYAAAIGCKHVVFTGDEIEPILLSNLIWLEPPRSHLIARSPNARADFSGHFTEQDANMPLEQRIEAAASAAGMTLPEARDDFRTAAWLGQIDVDLTKRVLMFRPIARDVRNVKTALYDQLLGGASCQ